jgi:hypothetical protein
MTSIIVLNQDNIVNAQNNTLVYKFPNSVQFPHHQIAVMSVNMYYSWTNVNSTPLANNTIQLKSRHNTVLPVLLYSFVIVFLFF